MKCPLPFLILAFPFIAGAQTYDFRILVKGREVGTMHEIVSESRASLSVHQVITLTANDRVTAVILDETDTPVGDWVETTMTLNRNGVSTTFTATPTVTGAHVVIGRNGKEVSKDYPRVSKLSPRNPTVDWFRIRIPKVGQTAAYQLFDIETLKWKDETLRYAGPASVRLGGKSRSGFRTVGVVGGVQRTSIVDKAAQILIYELGGSRIERVFK